MDEQQSSAPEPKLYGHYNPVNVNDALGTIFLGIIVIIMLVALLRAQARNRKLAAELSKTKP